jgi:hypothetical protein
MGKSNNLMFQIDGDINHKDDVLIWLNENFKQNWFAKILMLKSKWKLISHYGTAGGYIHFTYLLIRLMNCL